MNRIWKNIKIKWEHFWENDEDSEDKKHLSQYDKRNLLYGGFMVGACTMIVCVSTIVICNIMVCRQNAEDMEKVISTIATYMATATDDEYEKIAESIHNDLVFTEYGQEVKKLIKYIPNTSKSCSMERESYLDRIYLVFPNTGELYGLDIFEKAGNPEETQESTNVLYTFGYDEISETSLHIEKCLSEKSGSATIYRNRGIVSAQKIKDHFCDDCIREILNTTKNELVNEVVLCDIENKQFYPVAEGVMEIGDYSLQIEYEDGNYEIEVKYI